MDVSKSPIIVAFRCQILEFARSIGIMIRISGQGSMQNTDIEVSLERKGIGESKILCHRTRHKTLSVESNSDRQVVEQDCFRLPLAQDPGIAGEFQCAGNPVIRIVISFLDHDPDSLRVQPGKLIPEKYGNLHVWVIAIIEISGKNQEGSLLFDAEIDQALEGITGCPPHPIDLGSILKGEGSERTVQMNVGSMNELQSAPLSRNAGNLNRPEQKQKEKISS